MVKEFKKLAKKTMEYSIISKKLNIEKIDHLYFGFESIQIKTEFHKYELTYDYFCNKLNINPIEKKRYSFDKDLKTLNCGFLGIFSKDVWDIVWYENP